jgi:hypothetical protein|tara:strand:+ start:985 stop:1182 length:198 start_codon:yes stop_codon:yes gene_type:complete
MKIWITSFTYQDKEYAGPNVFASSKKKAQLLCNIQGLTLEGELTGLEEDLFYLDALETDENTVYH